MLPVLALALAAHAGDRVVAEAFLQSTPSALVAPGAGVRFEDDALYLSADARAYGGEVWTGRVGVGLDLLGGGGDWVVALGGFAGSAGGLDPLRARVAPSFGLEVRVGGRIGPVHGQVRRLDGFAGPLARHFDESEVRLGLVFLDTVEVFGQAVVFRPDSVSPVAGLGAGAALRF